MSWRDVLKPLASGTPSHSISPQYSQMPAGGDSEDIGDCEYRGSPACILRDAQSAGVHVRLADGSPRASGDPAALERWLPILRDYRAAVVAALEARARGLERLAVLALELRHPLADLLDWYRDDLECFGTLSTAQVEWIVRDYLANREVYRGQYAADVRFQAP